MRTKTLLGIAVLAGSALAASAQIYSQNIVGYVNVATPVGYSFQSSPLKAVTDGAADVLPNTGGARNGDQILLWLGAKWATYSYNSDQPSGFEDSLGNEVPAPQLTSGLGFLYFNGQPAAGANTYVGEVRTSPSTLTLRTTPIQAVGSMLPYAGPITTALNLVNTGGILNGCSIQTLINRPDGSVKGFGSALFNSDQPSGFEDTLGNETPEPNISMGTGFFFNNGTPDPITWTQTLP